MLCYVMLCYLMLCYLTVLYIVSPALQMGKLKQRCQSMHGTSLIAGLIELEDRCDTSAVNVN